MPVALLTTNVLTPTAPPLTHVAVTFVVLTDCTRTVGYVDVSKTPA